MSIATDSLDALFSDDMTVEVSANGIYSKGLLEQPTTVALGDNVLFTDYLIYLKASVYPKLKTGDAITVDNIDYTVREVQKGIDALILEVSLQKT
jgi:hypothetical protein